MNPIYAQNHSSEIMHLLNVFYIHFHTLCVTNGYNEKLMKPGEECLISIVMAYAGSKYSTEDLVCPSQKKNISCMLLF